MQYGVRRRVTEMSEETKSRIHDEELKAVTGGRVLEKLKDKAKETADKLTNGAIEVLEDIANHIVK